MSFRMVPLLLIGMACLLPAAQAAAEHPQNGRPHPSAHNPIKQGASLLDTYIQLLKPSVSVAPKQSGRSGRTTLEVKLAGASSVNPYTPTVSPEVSGTVFDVLNTWDALKSMAIAFRKADKLNQLSPDSQPLFPKASQATRLASIAPPVEASISAFAAEEPKLPSLAGFPPNLLMVPFGYTTGAIADLMDVSYDEATDSITLQLDVVHNPVVFSQFVEHTPCSVHTDEAHYHQLVRDPMGVDAQTLLQSLKDSSYGVEGVHVFLKSEPLAACLSGSTTPSTATLTVGESLNVTVNVVKTCKRAGTPAPDGTLVSLIVVPGTGNGEITETSPPPNTVFPKHARAPARRQVYDAYTLNGQAWFVVRATVAGMFSVEAASVDKGENLDDFSGITITAVPAPPRVAKLLLQPHKSYRRCGDPVTVTAFALDKNNAPVAGAAVSFAVYGDCDPEYAPSKHTDGFGKAQVKVSSHKSGVVAVVAAVNSAATGSVITTEPVHIVFYDEHSHADRREQEYFGGGYEEDSRDAWRYEREAAKVAEQRARNTPVAGSS